MHVAVLVSRYPTLSHTFIRREIEALRRRGARVDALAVRRADAWWRPRDADRNEEERTWYLLPIAPSALLAAHVALLARRPRRYLDALIRGLRHRRHGLRGALWSAFYFAEAVVLARELEARGVEHLHNHFCNGAATVGMLAARLAGIPWSLTLHGASDFGPEWSPLLPGKLREARFVACVSHYGRSQALRHLPPDAWHKVFVSRCGVEWDRLPGRRRAPGGAIRVVCVGRLSPEKGLPGLVEAFRGVRGRGLEAELVLVGDGPEREDLERRLEAGGIAAHCHMRGSRSEAEVLQEIADADVFVLASLMEGLPVVLMEALALGVPVVAPRLAGIPELVRDGENGLLFHPADWEGLEACLARLVEAPDERARMGAAGPATVRALHDVDRAVEPLWRRLRGLPAPVAPAGSERAAAAHVAGR